MLVCAQQTKLIPDPRLVLSLPPYSIRSEKLSRRHFELGRQTIPAAIKEARRVKPVSLDRKGAAASIRPRRRLSRSNGARGWGWPILILGNQPYSILSQYQVLQISGPSQGLSGTTSVFPTSSQREASNQTLGPCRALSGPFC